MLESLIYNSDKSVSLTSHRGGVLMKKLSNNGVLLFRTQLYLAFLPITVLPLAIVGYFSYAIASQALQTRSIANVGQISSLANQNLDSTV